jgi:hypothetical protein
LGFRTIFASWVSFSSRLMFPEPFSQDGLLLPGWHCQNPDCGVFNGSAKEVLPNCRCCDKPRGWRLNPEPADPGQRACHTPHSQHDWSQDGSGTCLRCGARAIRGHFGSPAREK